jgi:M6 family metalloprotease-like protein
VAEEDDFSRGISRTRYWIDLGAERGEVFFADVPGNLISGTSVHLRRIRLGKRMAATLTDVPQAAVIPSACGPVGEQKTAVLLLEFPNVGFPYTVVSPSEIHDAYFSGSQRSLDGFLREASYGKAFATGDVFGPFQLDRNYSYATEQPEALFAAIRAADPVVDFSIYNHIVLIWPVPGAGGWGGVGEFLCEHLSSPTKSDFIGTFVILAVGTRLPSEGIAAVAAHEAGHNLGLNHASSLDYGSQALGPPGVDGVRNEYGDPFAEMGGGEGIGAFAHFNAPHKARLGWLDPGSVQNVESDGTFLLQPFESPTGLRALRVRRGPAAINGSGWNTASRSDTMRLWPPSATGNSPAR